MKGSTDNFEMLKRKVKEPDCSVDSILYWATKAYSEAESDATAEKIVALLEEHRPDVVGKFYLAMVKEALKDGENSDEDVVQTVATFIALYQATDSDLVKSCWEFVGKFRAYLKSQIESRVLELLKRLPEG